MVLFCLKFLSARRSWGHGGVGGINSQPHNSSQGGFTLPNVSIFHSLLPLISPVSAPVECKNIRVGLLITIRHHIKRIGEIFG